LLPISEALQRLIYPFRWMNSIPLLTSESIEGADTNWLNIM